MEDISGKQLGPYVVVAPLGEGGMAAVYKAYQPAMDRYVALKILPRQYAADPDFVARFSREARVIAKLEHPNILPVFDFGKADDYTYIVMRFVETGTLADALRHDPLSLSQILRVTVQVGDALDYAHAQGVLHRDVKPSNILIDPSGHCLLTDFGLAKMVEGTIQLTATGAILGTPAYMSPEQGLGLPIDARSDIYSLGVVLYEMATGYLPYEAETPIGVVMKHIHAPLPLPRARNPALPEAVERVILKSLAKEPADRYATAGEMVRALRAAVPPGTSFDVPLPPVTRKPVARARPLGVRRVEEPQVEHATKFTKMSLQLLLYWKFLRRRTQGRIAWAFSGLFTLLLVAGAVGEWQKTGVQKGQTVGDLIGLIFVLFLFSTPTVLLSTWLSRRGRPLEQQLGEMVAREGNHYCCSCGEPMKRYNWLHVVLCVLLFPYGLLSLRFKLKKCRKCRRPYPVELAVIG